MFETRYNLKSHHEKNVVYVFSTQLLLFNNKYILAQIEMPTIDLIKSLNTSQR